LVQLLVINSTFFQTSLGTWLAAPLVSISPSNTSLPSLSCAVRRFFGWHDTHRAAIVGLAREAGVFAALDGHRGVLPPFGASAGLPRVVAGCHRDCGTCAIASAMAAHLVHAAPDLDLNILTVHAGPRRGLVQLF
jgi:hypothetical protein